MQVMMYTKQNCPLCDQAKDILVSLQAEIGFRLIERDIYENDTLLEKFQLMIPVLEIDDEPIMYGKIQREEIRKRLLLKIGNR
ncbi:glutaredoxin family protein [Priestia megaterium]|nr:glutaredoxin family protein [Priestia megaterium]